MLPKYYELTKVNYNNLTKSEELFSDSINKLIQCDDEVLSVKELISNFKKTYRSAFADVYDDNDNLLKEKLIYILSSMIEGLDNSKNPAVSTILSDFIFNDILANMNLKENCIDEVLLTYINEPILKNSFLKTSFMDVLCKANIS